MPKSDPHPAWVKLPPAGKPDPYHEGWVVESQDGVGYRISASFKGGWTVVGIGAIDPNGRPVITDFRVHQTDAKHGVHVTSNLLREMPSGHLLDEMRSAIGWELEKDNISTEYYEGDTFRQLIGAEYWPGRGHEPSDKTFACLAWNYLDLVLSGDTKPIESLRAMMGGCSRATASSRLAKARANGFLTAAPERTVGGQLTEKSSRLLGLAHLDLTDVAKER